MKCKIFCMNLFHYDYRKWIIYIFIAISIKFTKGTDDAGTNEIVVQEEQNKFKAKPERRYRPEDIPPNLETNMNDFDYMDNGPVTWPKKFRWCSGINQSPIALDTISSKKAHRPHIHWMGYSQKPSGMSLKNNGHTVSLTAKFAETPFHWMTEDDHDGREYVFDQLHFHWGPEDSVGSEHTLNGERFPLEMHIVHHRRELESKENAALYHNGLRVIAVFYRISDHDNPELEDIVNMLDSVQHPDAEVSIVPFPINKLFHTFKTLYLTYNGSLTTPPCAETVSWVVYKMPSFISKDQIMKFRLLTDHDGHNIHMNYRPIQPLNGRSVLHVR